MNYFDTYKARMNASGKSISEAQTNSSARFIEYTFADSPFYRVAKLLNGNEIELRLMDINVVTRGNDIQLIQYSMKFAVLKPHKTIDIGEVLRINDQFWLVVDFTLENQLYPKAKIQLCNYKLPIKTGETSVLKGYDSLGRPIYVKQPTYTEVYCFIKDYMASANINQPVNSPVGRMYITAKYDGTTKLVKENDEIILYDKKYKISGSNLSNTFNGVGVVTFIADRVVTT